MNKKEFVAKIKQLDGLTPEERAELVNLLNTKKKYGLIWEDKPEDVEEQLRTKLPVLREVVEKRILATKSASEAATPKTIKTNLFSAEESNETTSFSPPLEGLGEVIYCVPNYLLPTTHFFTSPLGAWGSIIFVSFNFLYWYFQSVMLLKKNALTLL